MVWNKGGKVTDKDEKESLRQGSSGRANAQQAQGGEFNP
jgi:hypothetical protein